MFILISYKFNFKISASLLVDKNDLTQQDTEKLAKSFFDIIAGGGDSFDRNLAVFFEKLRAKFPKSNKIKRYLIDVYNILLNNGNKDDDYFTKMENLIGNKPKNENAALTKAYALESKYSDDLCYLGRTPDWEKCLKNVDKIEELFNWYPDSEDIALVFADALVALTLKQDTPACQTTVQKLENLFCHAISQQMEKASWFAGRLGKGLCCLCKKQNEQEAEKTIAKIEEIVSRFPDKPMVVCNLGYAFEDFSKYKQGKEKEQIVKRLMEISDIWQPAANIADRIR